MAKTMPERVFLFSSESVNEGHPDKLCDQATDPGMHAQPVEQCEGGEVGKWLRSLEEQMETLKAKGTPKKKLTRASKRLEYLKRRRHELDAEMTEALLARDWQRMDDGMAALQRLKLNQDLLAEV